MIRPSRLAHLLVLASFGLAGASSSLAAQPATEPAATACDSSLPALFARVSPSVVSIGAMSIDPYDAAHRLQWVTGSGVVVDASGLIVTNAHVVFGRQAVRVTLHDGSTLPARLLGADPLFDIALLRVEVPAGMSLPAARPGRSDQVVVGQEVYAIGSPFGLDQSLTRGIVSAINRRLPGATWSLTEPLIQTDASINPGSSGGPLLDACGAVIGITTAMLPDAQNIGFAIPVALVQSMIPSLAEHGRVIRPWLGVQGQMVTDDLKALLRVPLVDGFLVEVVEPGSPAAGLGIEGGGFELVIGGQPVLLGGDIITAIDGRGVTEPARLIELLSSLEVGKTVRLTLVRAERTRDLDVVVAERPLRPTEASNEHRDAGTDARPLAFRPTVAVRRSL